MKRSTKRRLKKAFLIIVILSSVLGILSGIAFGINRFSFNVELNAESEITLEYSEEYIKPDATSVLRGSLFFKNGIDTQREVFSTGDVDTSKIGTYKVKYSSSFLWWNSETEQIIKVEDNKSPKITLKYDLDKTTVFGQPYVEEGFSAYDEYDGDLTDAVKREEKDGKVIYTVSDSSGNVVKIEREINYIYPEPPVLNLSGDSEITIEAGDPYKEPGYTAFDCFGVELTDKVTVSGEIDVNTAGEYVIEYSVTDSFGKTAVAKRYIKVNASSSPSPSLPPVPIITLYGESEMMVYVNGTFIDPGCYATAYDGEETPCAVTVTGKVDVAKAGTYTLTYTCKDAFDQTATATRTVIVAERPQNNTVIPDGKVIYLTFDDGPSAYTTQLLDILDKYDVKATFFVVDSGRYDTMREIVKRGHSIGIHSVTHDYGDIYASTEAFFNDLYGMQELIYEQTGVLTTLMRFPGGSSNTVSSFNPGIMTTLSVAVEQAGFQYFDWHVSSEDAAGAYSQSQVYYNVINGIKWRNVSIVLQHDTKKFSIDAVEDIIIWGLENGYTFLPLTPESPTAHHGINN